MIWIYIILASVVATTSYYNINFAKRAVSRAIAFKLLVASIIALLFLIIQFIK